MLEKLGMLLAEETDVERLKADVVFLWSLLDDIDTASDMAKNNDASYRARVEQLQGRRHQRVISDGYDNVDFICAGIFRQICLRV
jgi:hypothetical protein